MVIVGLLLRLTGKANCLVNQKRLGVVEGDLEEFRDDGRGKRAGKGAEPGAEQSAGNRLVGDFFCVEIRYISPRNI